MAPPSATRSRDARSTTAGAGNAVPHNSKWIFVNGNGEPEHFETIAVLLPEYVVRQVPRYALELDVELAKPGYNQNVLFTIKDDHMHDKLIYNYAIQFLASGLLPDLGGNELACDETLATLLLLYDFKVEMSGETLELAVIKHIDDFKDLTLPMFLDFARTHYANDENTHDGEKESLALLIKKKLAKFMPQINKRKMVQEIQKDGKQGQQFVDVLAEVLHKPQRGCEEEGCGNQR
ncbi:hypothetical protein MBLNU13_g01751t1 [Cladosporium sp. NU13]